MTRAFNPVVLYGGLPVLFSDMLKDLESVGGIKCREAYLSGFDITRAVTEQEPLSWEEFQRIARRAS